MTADRIAREQGSRDHRLLPVAMSMWMASLCAHQLFTVWSQRQEPALDSEASDGIPVLLQLLIHRLLPLVVPVFVTGIALLLLALICMMRAKVVWSAMLSVCIAAASIAATVAVAADTLTWLDPAFQHVRADDSATIIVEGSATTPVLVSDHRDYDCQVDMRLNAVIVNGISQRSFASVRLYAARSECALLQRGAQYRIIGRLCNAEYGRMPLWFLAETASPSNPEPIVHMRAPPWHRSVVTRMQQSFFRVTDTLSDQGRVLVPGMTMGVLGQDYFDASSQSTPIDDTYASTVEDSFRKAGIMHLMAVSGGHFVLLAALIRRIGMWLLADRRVIAVFMAAAYMALSAIVFPGDSVTRALIMGLMGALCYAFGRRSQALSALCWTVIGVLVLNPQMSQSYGFALSCAAVLGIVLYANRIERVLCHVLPRPIAQAMAMTVAAQLFTMPIQVLMEPELPVLSVPANLLVSPFVSLATITGLLALCCAWCAPAPAYALAQMSSWCTLVMERIAQWLGGSDMATMPWAGGVGGALLVLAVEGAIAAILMTVRHWWRHRHIESGLPGERFGSHAARRVRISLWWQETIHLLARR